jgi:hypothetical protein
VAYAVAERMNSPQQTHEVHLRGLAALSLGRGQCTSLAPSSPRQSSRGVHLQGANEFAAGKSRSPPSWTGGSAVGVRAVHAPVPSHPATDCHSEGAHAPNHPYPGPCARPRNLPSEPRGLLHVPICRPQSAKADFVPFQRRIHSLVEGTRHYSTGRTQPLRCHRITCGTTPRSRSAEVSAVGHAPPTSSCCPHPRADRCGALHGYGRGDTIERYCSKP